MKAYSIDLRQKIVDAYACGDISQRKLAKNFGVTLSFVQNLLKRDGTASAAGHRELGTIVPKVRTEQTPTFIECRTARNPAPIGNSTARCDARANCGNDFTRKQRS
ncbi:MAG: hypothetical protein KA716_26505 [Gloeotrichia echinulata DEX184]|nr:hypothetical protein [Gloeotrichia echinulata DEX184]